MDFYKIYENAHNKEEEFLNWTNDYQNRHLKESVIKEASNGDLIPQEKMSEVYRIFESYVGDNEWDELRETIIDLENLEKKIFHQGFEHALKEDQNHILENYAKSYTFEPNLHLVESYDNIELWNNDKRRKELNKERFLGGFKKIFKNEYLNEEIESMIQQFHLFEADGIVEEPSEEPKKVTKEEIISRINSREDIKSAGISYIISKSRKSPGTIRIKRPNNPVPRPMSEGEIEAFKKLFIEEKSNIEKVVPIADPVTQKPEETSSKPEPATPASVVPSKIESITTKDIERNTTEFTSLTTDEKRSLTVDILEKKLISEFNDAETTTLETDGLDSKEILKKKLSAEKAKTEKANKRLFDIEAKELRVKVLASYVNEANEADLQEMKSLQKETSKFAKLKAKIFNFIKRKAPLLGKIISFAGAAFGIATKFGTITTIFAPLGPFAPIVALIVSTALFFIQKKLFNMVGKATDKIIENFFRSFIAEKAAGRGPIAFICKKLKSGGRAEAVTKIIVRILTSLLLAKPTAGILTSMVKGLSGPMIAGLTSIGLTAEGAGAVLPEGLGGKLGDITKWAEGKTSSPPVEPQPTPEVTETPKLPPGVSSWEQFRQQVEQRLGPDFENAAHKGITTPERILAGNPNQAEMIKMALDRKDFAFTLKDGDGDLWTFIRQNDGNLKYFEHPNASVPGIWKGAIPEIPTTTPPETMEQIATTSIPPQEPLTDPEVTITSGAGDGGIVDARDYWRGMSALYPNGNVPITEMFSPERADLLASGLSNDYTWGHAYFQIRHDFLLLLDPANINDLDPSVRSNILLNTREALRKFSEADPEFARRLSTETGRNIGVFIQSGRLGML